MTTAIGGHRLVAMAEELIANHKEAMQESGGDEAGYVKLFGNSVVLGKWADSGQARYRADISHLERLQSYLAQVRGRR